VSLLTTFANSRSRRVGTWCFSLKDNYVLPVKGVVDKILAGVNALAALIEREFTPKPGA
jgi:hypothetical protein